MATLGPPSPPLSPSLGSRRRRWARKIERCYCATFTYFPLPFVYGLTSWAVWVASVIGFQQGRPSWAGPGMSAIGVFLFILLNWSYTVAVFVDPGSPVSVRSGYSHLPTHESRSSASFTVKSTGDARYCKKCQAQKPDRAHHCSTCKRCVLKMDHHCPWLATCLGLRNYKAFVLFLLYTTFFCWVCFTVSASWVWSEVLTDAQYEENLMPINNVLLAVLAGIIGLVLAGFTGWHLSLAWRNQTTIECLERTRYLTPLRNTFQNEYNRQSNGNGGNTPSYGQQLVEIHANTLPGVTRPEEGEERQSPVPNSGNYIRPARGGPDPSQRTYNEFELSQQRDRYEEYLDEKDSERLPNAFNLGWKRNLTHLFGANPLLWCVPICNTSGDGWNWEPSPAWLQARDDIRREREAQWIQQHELNDVGGLGTRRAGGDTFRTHQFSEDTGYDEHYLSTSNRAPARAIPGRRSPFKADKVLGRGPDQFVDDPISPELGHSGQNGFSMRTLRGRKEAWEEDDDGQYELSSDEEEADRRLMPRPTINTRSSGGFQPKRGDKDFIKSL